MREAAYLSVTVLVAGVFCACGLEDTMEMGVPLPDLRIQGSLSLDREDWRALVVMDDEGARVRCLYRTDDGGPRERRLNGEDRIPWPEDAVVEKKTFRRPAIVLFAGPDQRWNDLLRRLPHDKRSAMPRLYLAARGRGGRVLSLPVQVPPDYFEWWIASLGAALNSQDVSHGVDQKGVMTVRVTRDGDYVRYRWEPSPMIERETRWTGGDVTLPDAAVRSRGSGPLIPALAKYMETRFEVRDLRGKIVFLETTDEALAIDVLRAVECARGDPDVWFFPHPFPWRWSPDCPALWHLIDPPRPATIDGLEPERSLRKIHEHPGYILVQQDPDGVVGRYWRHTPEQMDERLREYLAPSRRPGDTIILRIDRETPWSHCGNWVRKAVRSGRLVRLRFTLGDYRLDPEGALPLPRYEEVAGRARVRFAEVRRNLKSVRDRHVLLVSPGTATCGDVWNAALRLVNAGAKSIDFE